MSLEFVFETHQTTVDNEAGIADGRLPGRLSDLGRRQARELGERRRDDGLAAVGRVQLLHFTVPSSPSTSRSATKGLPCCSTGGLSV